MFPIGQVCYSLDEYSNTSGYGISFTYEELDYAINGPVSSIFFDEEGISEIDSFIATIPDTDFDEEEIKRLLKPDLLIEDWRVGESIAESFLITHRSCSFPWPDARDMRNSNSSLPGADLVGIISEDSNVVFTFGEVKTSIEEKYPPQLIYGRSGLTGQIEDLRDDVTKRDQLVKYLGFRAIRSAWEDKFIVAFKNYSKNSANVRLFGILVRDIPPNEKELKTRVSALNCGCPPYMIIELIALYFPLGSIPEFPDKVRSAYRAMRRL